MKKNLLPEYIAMGGCVIIVSKPPPRRNVAKAIITIMKVADEGFDDSLRNHRLSENDIDEASLLTLFVIFHFSVPS